MNLDDLKELRRQLDNAISFAEVHGLVRSFGEDKPSPVEWAYVGDFAVKWRYGRETFATEKTECEKFLLTVNVTLKVS